MQRREFLQQSANAVAFAMGGSAWAAAASAPGQKLKSVVIGHTGRGDYGHSLDVIFNDRPGIEVVAVADPDAAGRAKAQQKTKALRAYSDYRDMLEKERPQLVSVAPRWTDQHHATIRAALQVGAHVYCEKPFTRTLVEADDLLALAKRTGRRIAVAHKGKLSPTTALLKKRINEGLIGDLLEIRVHGKQDHRAGGEDMLVLGSHQFDLVRFFAGDPLWCTARVLQNGRDITRADARVATEDIGPVAGDEVQAMFALPGGVNAHYTSRAKYAPTAGLWGLEFVGSKGRVRMLNDVVGGVLLLTKEGGSGREENLRWTTIQPDPSERDAFVARNKLPPNSWATDDWLAAIAEGREPVCSGEAAMRSIEMIHAVWTAGLTGARVAFPLKRREHPLA